MPRRPAPPAAVSWSRCRSVKEQRCRLPPGVAQDGRQVARDEGRDARDRRGLAPPRARRRGSEDGRAAGGGKRENSGGARFFKKKKVKRSPATARGPDQVKRL